MGRRFAPLEFSEVERAELKSLASRRSTAQGLGLRAGIILACVEGEQSKVVAARLGIDPDTVGKWRRRFAEHRLEGLWDEPRSRCECLLEELADRHRHFLRRADGHGDYYGDPLFFRLTAPLDLRLHAHFPIALPRMRQCCYCSPSGNSNTYVDRHHHFHCKVPPFRRGP